MAITKTTLTKYKKIIDKWFTNEFNGREAYKAFFPKSKDSTATTNFSKIQNIPEIKEYIKQKNEEVARFVKIDHEGVLSELKRWIELDVTEFIGLSLDEIKSLPVELRRLIKIPKRRVSKKYDKKGNLVSEFEEITLYFVDKERAMEMLNKHIGFYEIDNKQKANSVDLASLSTSELIARAKMIKDISKNG
jgi:phage terminase small subunit